MKGSVGGYIMALASIALFSFVYIALNEAYSPLHTFATGIVTNTESTNTITLLNIMWVWIPIGVLFSYVVSQIVKSKEESEFG